MQGRRFTGRARAGTGSRSGSKDVKTLTVRIAAVRKPAGRDGGAGGIRELRIDGLHAREALRPPTIAERSVAPDAALTYLFQRTTGDDPFRRTPKRGPAGAALVRDRLDGETGITRVFNPPTARTYTVDGWASAAATAPDDALDRLVGGPAGFTSSGALRGQPRLPRLERVRRHGPAVDRRLPRGPHDLDRVERRRSRRSARSRSIRCLASGGRPACGVVADGTPSAPVDVADDTGHGCPAPLTGRRFRLEILRGARATRRRRGSAARSGSPRSAAPRPPAASRAPAP